MLNQPLSLELKHETDSTRRMLANVPYNQKDWQPHQKSMPLGRLSNHIADIVNWIPRIINTNEFDIMDPSRQYAQAENKEQLMAMFEKNVQGAMDALKTATDENLKGNWTLRRGDHILFTLPRIAAIRNIATNHAIHHRGQLSVYLRLLGVSVPGMYGPSADEMNF